MSGLSLGKLLPIIDAEECIPCMARLTRRASTEPYMEIIEEEEPGQIDLDIAPCSDSDSSSSSSASAAVPPPHSTASLVPSDEKPRNEIPKDVLEYVERIRVAINAQRDRTAGARAADSTPKPNVNGSAKQAHITTKKRTAFPNALAERTKDMLRKLTDSRKKVSTLLVVKPKTKARSEKKPASIKDRTVLLGLTKIGRVQYVHGDKKGRPISLSAACGSVSDKEVGSPLKSPGAVHEEDEGHSLWIETNDTRPKYDLRTGRRLGESRSLNHRVKDAAISVRRSAVKGIETGRKQVSKKRGKGKWYKIK
ncbi:hypothetical protein LTR84_008492 [Exophiala bonariae]|uniref:Uncharacterized protein n=1 Tax=Exophiala bonariae TaxID=1690606 RepID=A0AAV9N0C9_9EURO|nr:hypothetical protein LTR84_008492 [Exophiala bonariae]